jgi:hypothetical protein
MPPTRAFQNLKPEEWVQVQELMKTIEANMLRLKEGREMQHQDKEPKLAPREKGTRGGLARNSSPYKYDFTQEDREAAGKTKKKRTQINH